MAERPWTVSPRNTDPSDGAHRDEASTWSTCPNCEEAFTDCVCVCPYCGESRGCTCCIGYETATGG